MSLQYPKHLHSPKDDGSFVVVHDEHEEAAKRKEGWLTAPPSQTKGQDAYAHALAALEHAAAEGQAVIDKYVDEEADAMPPPKKHKGKKKAE